MNQTPVNTEALHSDLRLKHLTLKYFFAFFSGISLFLFSISLPIYLHYVQGIEDQLIAQEETSVVAARQMIQREMYEQLHIFDMVVKSNILNAYINDNSLENQLRLEDFFKSISTSFHRFDQIRLLDNTGKEAIRVNLVKGEGVLVAADELQNKADRYYFKSVQQMPAGQIYVSPMDLNIENDVIELPHKPTLRISTRLYNEQGEAAGVFVINYLAKGMLERFRHLMTQRTNQQGMLLDSQGYWLSNHVRSNEWGADLGKPDHKFASFYPKAWPSIKANSSGILEIDSGIFRYKAIEPLNYLEDQPAHFRLEHHPTITKESFANTSWKLVIFIPREKINQRTFLYQPFGRALTALILVLVAVLSFFGASFLVQQKNAAQKEKQTRLILEKQANIDALTGINNRRSFYELAEKELKQAKRKNTPLAVLMLDADHFKKVNDTYGHAIGDLVLKYLANSIKTTLRDVDLSGRVGGEEFAVLLPQTPLQEALEIAERLRKALEACQVPLPEGDSISFTVSIGLAMLTIQEEQFDQLMNKADLALYQAKSQGRNRVEQAV
ncbi:sensor domain-containing diguanylate cyclase [Marinospirillum insulare]|uniref:diguanylate cyclase n=1 Tax=Marinospirillum insulare TaxID=217169 RepID=A0ABQ6A2A8_9GAMM|nr:sensor domain-containing diguanylate cyclase [Marinospirillum insulare]GLR64244.1 GGDEF domain-containing protein [Marinospirillum insulare]